MEICLPYGSLYVLDPPTNGGWAHAIEPVGEGGREEGVEGEGGDVVLPRLSLTFRRQRKEGGREGGGEGGGGNGKKRKVEAADDALERGGRTGRGEEGEEETIRALVEREDDTNLLRKTGGVSLEIKQKSRKDKKHTRPHFSHLYIQYLQFYSCQLSLIRPSPPPTRPPSTSSLRV